MDDPYHSNRADRATRMLAVVGRHLASSAAQVEVVAIGLGSIGSPLAGRIGLKFRTAVYDLFPEAVRRHTAEHPTAVGLDKETLAAAASKAKVIFTCLPNTVNVVEAYEAIRPQLGPSNGELIWLDATSGKSVDAKALAEMLWTRHKIRYCDCAVSGGPAGARKGTLAALVGGETAAFERVTGVIESFSPSSKITHLGNPGSGHLVKSLNNAMLGAHMLVASEAMACLVREGVDIHKALNAINGSSGRSWVTMQRFPDNVLTGDPYGFAIGLHCKDMRNAMGVVTPIRAPMLSLAQGRMEAARAEMGDKVDHTSTCAFAERANGISFLQAGAKKA